MTTRIASYPSDSGRSVMKSMAIDFHGLSGASLGCNRPYGACRTTFVRWQVSQFLTYCLIVSLMPGQKYHLLTSSVVFAVPPCPADMLSWFLLIMSVRSFSSSGIQIFPLYLSDPSSH